jgi:hypothetical protein
MTIKNPSNYRPISILPRVSKIFEWHIANQIQFFFRKTNIIHKTQSGFRQYHSCHKALIRLLEARLTDIDARKYVGTVFLDLIKAFDLVEHEILLHKFKLCHFSDKSVYLFKSYLSNRTKLLMLDNSRLVTSGVPRGSIRGPFYSYYT